MCCVFIVCQALSDILDIQVVIKIDVVPTFSLKRAGRESDTK